MKKYRARFAKKRLLFAYQSKHCILKVKNARCKQVSDHIWKIGSKTFALMPGKRKMVVFHICRFSFRIYHWY